MYIFIRKTVSRIKTTQPLTIIIALYLMLGISLVTKYGVTYAEPQYYGYGEFILEKILDGNTGPIDIQEQTKGTIFKNNNFWAYAVLLNIAGKLPGISNFTLYHFINYLLFLPVLIFTYMIVLNRYKDRWLAFLGPIFLLLTPRLFGELFINPFDVPFTVFYFCSLSAIYFLQHSESRLAKDLLFKTVILGILFGLSQSFRTWGFTLYPLYLLMAAHTLSYRYKESALSTKFKYLGNSFKELLLIGIISSVVTLLLWPYIASNPINNYPELFSNFTTVTNTGVTGSNTLFLWLLVTTPFSVLFLFLLSFTRFKEKIKDDLFFMLFSVLFLNGILFFTANPELFNGVRHALFLLPIISLISFLTFTELVLEEKKLIYKQIFASLIFLQLASVGYEMIKMHPYEYAYFNEAAGRDGLAHALFEGEYWKTSFKESSTWVLKDIQKNNKQNVSVFSCDMRENMILYSKNLYNIAEKETNADYLVCPYEIFHAASDFRVEYDGALINSVIKISK